MKKIKKTKLLTGISFATLIAASTVTIASCSKTDIANAFAQSSEVTSDIDVVNIVPNVGYKQEVQLSAIFKDYNDDVIEGVKPKWVTNIESINYYTGWPDGMIELDEDKGVLTVDPNKITDSLYSCDCDLTVWAQTPSGKLESNQMIGKNITIVCTPDIEVPHVAEITNNKTLFSIACGQEQNATKGDLGITYWSGVYGEEAFDNTIWTVTDRGNLPKEIEINVVPDKTNIRNGILTIDPKNCSQSSDDYYNVTVKAQSKKCPTVFATTTFQVALYGNTTVASANITGADSITVDPKTPTPYTNFKYNCNILNTGGVVIDNSPKTWSFAGNGQQTLWDDYKVKVEFKDDALVIDTSATDALTSPASVDVIIVGTSDINPSVVASKTVKININKFNSTPANVNLNNSKEVVVKANQDPVVVDYSSLILVNKNNVQLTPSATGTFDLRLSNNQSRELVNSKITCSVTDNKKLIVDTSKINPDLINLRTDLTVNLIASYYDISTNTETEHVINICVNPADDSVAYSTILAEDDELTDSYVTISTGSSEPLHTNTKFAIELWNKENVVLAGLTPIVEYNSNPEIPDEYKDKILITFDPNNDNEMIVDATAIDHLDENLTFTLTVFCKKYLDANGNEQTVTDESQVQTSTVILIISDGSNFIKTKTSSETIDLKSYINPNEFCSSPDSSGDYYINVTKKGETEEKVKINVADITHISINTCDTSEEAKTLGDNFLLGKDGVASSLTSIDLNGLVNVRTIGNNFLKNSNALKTVDLSPLTTATSIGNEFLSFSGIESTEDEPFDLSGLKNIATVGNYFFQGNTSLEYLDFTKATKFAEINQGFLYNCDNLTKVNMGTISANSFISTDYVFCTSNSSAKIYNPGLTLISVGDSANYNVKFGTQITTAPYRNVDVQASANTIVYDGLGYDLADEFDPNALCGDLMFQLPLKNKSKDIGGAFVIPELTKSRITSLTISKLAPNITSIGDDFLKGCSGLKEINFNGLKDIQTIGDSFLSGCSNLKEVDLSPMTSLVSIGKSFAYNCPYLVEVNIGNINAACFAPSQYTLSHTSVYDRGYGVGTLIKGLDKEAFATQFVELEDNSTYRYLVTDEKFNFVQLTDGKRYELDDHAPLGSFCGDANSSPSFTVYLHLKDVSLKPITMGEIRNISFRNAYVRPDRNYIESYFLREAESLRNLYLSDCSQIVKINEGFLSYCFNLRSVDLGCFPNLKEIQGHHFLHKNNAIRTLDFSVLRKEGEDLAMTGDSDPVVDCYNLMEINFGRVKPTNLLVDAKTAFGIRNQISTPAYLLGRAFVGVHANDIISRFYPTLWIEKTEGEDHFNIKVVSKSKGDINIDVRIWIRNSRQWNSEIDSIIDELIEKLPS